jgi:hypothetical protein
MKEDQMAKAPTTTKTKEPVPPRPEGGPITGTLPAAAPMQLGREGSVIEVGGVKIKIAKQVTRRVFPQVAGEPLPVKITGPIYKGEEIKQGKSKDMAAADLAPVEHCITKELGLIIVGAVLKGELERQYPKVGDTWGYVNKSFAISTGPQAEGKRFRPVTLFEIEVEG